MGDMRRDEARCGETRGGARRDDIRRDESRREEVGRGERRLGRDERRQERRVKRIWGERRPAMARLEEEHALCFLIPPPTTTLTNLSLWALRWGGVVGAEGGLASSRGGASPPPGCSGCVVSGVVWVDFVVSGERERERERERESERERRIFSTVRLSAFLCNCAGFTGKHLSFGSVAVLRLPAWFVTSYQAWEINVRQIPSMFISTGSAL